MSLSDTAPGRLAAWKTTRLPAAMAMEMTAALGVRARKRVRRRFPRVQATSVSKEGKRREDSCFRMSSGCEGQIVVGCGRRTYCLGGRLESGHCESTRVERELVEVIGYIEMKGIDLGY